MAIGSALCSSAIADVEARLNVEPHNVTLGGSVNVTVRVLGMEPPCRLVVHVEVNGETIYNSSATVLSSEALISFLWTPRKLGNYTLTLVAFINGTEISDNSTLTVNPPQPQATVNIVKVDKSEVGVGEPIDIQVNATYIGVGGYVLELRADNDVIYSFKPTFTGGHPLTCTFNVTWTPSKSGRYKLQAAWRGLDERDEYRDLIIVTSPPSLGPAQLALPLVAGLLIGLVVGIKKARGRISSGEVFQVIEEHLPNLVRAVLFRDEEVKNRIGRIALDRLEGPLEEVKRRMREIASGIEASTSASIQTIKGEFEGRFRRLEERVRRLEDFLQLEKTKYIDAQLEEVINKMGELSKLNLPAWLMSKVGEAISKLKKAREVKVYEDKIGLLREVYDSLALAYSEFFKEAFEVTPIPPPDSFIGADYSKLAELVDTLTSSITAYLGQRGYKERAEEAVALISKRIEELKAEGLIDMGIPKALGDAASIAMSASRGSWRKGYILANFLAHALDNVVSRSKHPKLYSKLIALKADGLPLASLSAVTVERIRERVAQWRGDDSLRVLDDSLKLALEDAVTRSIEEMRSQGFAPSELKEVEKVYYGILNDCFEDPSLKVRVERMRRYIM